MSSQLRQPLALAAVDEMNGHRESAALRGELARIGRMREDIAKAWLVDVIVGSPLAEVEALPTGWATSELPELISDVLAAVAESARPSLPRAALARAALLAQLRADSAPPQLTRDISSLQSTLLAALREELPKSDRELFAEAAERIATVFGQVTAAAVDALLSRSDVGRDPVSGLQSPAQLRSRLAQAIATTTRYGHPFALVLIDFEGPGTRDEVDQVAARAKLLRIVAGALRESVRATDETFRLDDDQLCVLAANQTTTDGTRMAGRLAGTLADLEAAGGLQITISAGVVSCPEHGNDAERLLRQADTAMWRSRATGQPVTVGGLQDR
jgi:diguanylate cyclase (GGDEF)-like protein